MSVILRRCLAGLVILGLAAGAAHASPVINLQTYSDWSTAISGGTVRPMTASEYSGLVSGNPGFNDAFSGGIYSVPQVQAASNPDYTLEGGEKISGAGMYMGWGEVGQDTYTAAWRYEYQLDPNVVGQTITVTVCPPKSTAAGAQMNSIAIGLTDASVPIPLTRTWTWNCAAAANAATNTIAWNQNWNVTIGPIAGMIPPAVAGPAAAVDQATSSTTIPPIFFSAGAVPPPVVPPFFNPGTVMFLDGYENGGAPWRACRFRTRGLPAYPCGTGGRTWW